MTLDSAVENATEIIAAVSAVAVLAIRAWFQVVAATRAVELAEAEAADRAALGQGKMAGAEKHDSAVGELRTLHPILRPSVKRAAKLAERAYRKTIQPRKQSG